MDEEKPKKKHKKNWREEYASVTDIESFLSDRIMLRYNVVTRRVEYRLVERSVWDAKHGQVHGSRQWENISDRIVNSLWTELSATKPVRAPDIYRVIESDFVPEYDPFRFYKNVRGYIAVRRSAEEMRSVRHLMADSPEHTDTDDTDVF